MMRMASLTLAACAVWCLPAIQAGAQVLPSGKGWKDLPRPEYDALGIPAGGFQIYPSLVSSAEYDSNVRALQTNELDDFRLGIRPQVSVESQWSRHELDLSAFVDSSFYLDLGTEDHTDYGVNGAGTFEIGSRSFIEVKALYNYLHENRGFIDTARLTQSPIAFSQFKADVIGYHQFNKLDVSIETGFDSRDFRDGLSFTNAVIDQDFRDFSKVYVEGTLGYEFSPGYSVFAAARYETFDFDLSPTDPNFRPGVDVDRSFDAIRFDAGVSAEITDVMYANFAVGIFEVSPDAQGFGSSSDLSLRGDLLWNITSLTTVRAGLSRIASSAILAQVPIRTDTSGNLGIDHELLYNLILSADANYARFKFEGANRVEEQLSASLNARYLLNNYVSIVAGYRFSNQDSSLAGFGFDRHRVQVSVNLSL